MDHNQADLAVQDVARLAGVSRGRIAQMYGAQQMPTPDAPTSTPTRARWRRSTIERWLVSIGKRPDWSESSWLIPGPDGPRLEHLDVEMVSFPAKLPSDRYDTQARGLMHVRTYCDKGSDRQLWLVTPVLPTTSVQLYQESSLPDDPRQTPLEYLAERLADHGYRPLPKSGHLGSIVVLPVQGEGGSGWDDNRVLVAEVTRSRQIITVHPPRWTSNPQELRDLVQALGHQLPWWPAGCATAELIAASRPGGKPPRCEVPPFLLTAWRYHQTCEALAGRAPADIREQLAELGRLYWRTKQNRHRYAPDDTEVWTPAIDVQLPDVPHSRSNWRDALRWVLSTDDVPAWVADESSRYYGDPDSAGVAVLDLTALPDPIAGPLRTSGPVADTGMHSCRARQVKDALTPYGDVEVDRWNAVSGVDWRARVGDRVVVHVPRCAPADIGEYLDVTIVAQSAGRHVGIITTAKGEITFLPVQGDAETLAMAVEHVKHHPGMPVDPAGVFMPDPPAALRDAVGAVIDVGGGTIAWRLMLSLAGEHPDSCILADCPHAPRGT